MSMTTQFFSTAQVLPNKGRLFVIPTHIFPQSRVPGGYFGHPASRTYFQSQISTPFCFKIPNPSLEQQQQTFICMTINNYSIGKRIGTKKNRFLVKISVTILKSTYKLISNKTKFISRKLTLLSLEFISLITRSE